jgi:hydroxymethylglutaryl-CoA lyase
MSAPRPRIHEVGMRDGLQAEREIVPTDRKIAWIDRLIAAGVDIVQVGSFVNPAVLPQMADTDAIVRHYAARPPTRARLSALVLNEKGLDRGLAAGVRYFCMGVSASDTHSRRNTGMGTDEAAPRILAMACRARDAGATVQLSVQSAFGCGYDGAIPQSRVLAIASSYVDAGFDLVSLADTAGHATPSRAAALVDALRAVAPDADLACHFHDTYGLAMANACAALDAGVQTFETAFGGLGGCPFTALAGGNLCTEDFVHLLHREHRRPEVDLDGLVAVTNEAEAFFGRPLPGILHRSGPIAWR